MIACGLQEQYRYYNIPQFDILCHFASRLLDALSLLDLPVVITEDLYCYGPIIKVGIFFTIKRFLRVILNVEVRKGRIDIHKYCCPC